MEHNTLLERFPRVRIDADNVEYYRGLIRSELRINCCDDCGRWHHPPRSVCPSCWSANVTARPASGDGTIALVTILRQGPREPGIDYQTGFPLVAVELDEQRGLRLTGTVIGVPLEQIRPGRRVRVVWSTEPDAPPRADFEIVD